MRIIRRGTFETNSSSTHSLTMCTKDDYEKLKNGELVYYIESETLEDKKQMEEQLADIKKDFIERHPDFDPNNEEWQYALEEEIKFDLDYYTYDQYHDYYGEYYETYHQDFTTPNGEEIVAFGYYGYN